MAAEEEIRDYCLRRPLSRPNVNCLLLLPLLFIYEGMVQLCARLVCEWTAMGAVAGYLSVQVLFLLLFGRWLAILMVMLYQRHAPEHIRRRCHCRPSCSEYAIAVFRRFGLIVGGYKTIRRVFFTCGATYVDDAPY